MISRILAFAGGALIGGGVGYLLAHGNADQKYKAEYTEATASHRRALELASQSRVKNVFADNEEINREAGVEAPVESEEDLTDPLFEDVPKPGSWLPKTQEKHEPATENPYHTAIAATETPVDTFIDGGINDYGVSYIEEEEYQEDDGRAKETIVIYMDEHNPLFTMNGGEIRDWDERVGDSILLDMFKHCPPGKRQVLYVRNHKTDVDYEVVRDTP